MAIRAGALRLLASATETSMSETPRRITALPLGSTMERPETPSQGGAMASAGLAGTGTIKTSGRGGGSALGRWRGSRAILQTNDASPVMLSRKASGMPTREEDDLPQNHERHRSCRRPVVQIETCGVSTRRHDDSSRPLGS